MKLDLAFRLSSILLAATSFTSLALALALPPWLLVLAILAFVLALLRVDPASLLSRHLSLFRISPMTWNVFLVIAFVGFWVDLLLISQDILHAGIHFLILLLINKLSNLDQRRDVLQLYAISLITLLASAALTTQVWYAPILSLYLVTAVWTLLLYHLDKEQDQYSSIQSDNFQPPPVLSVPVRVTARFFWTTNALALATFALTLLIFFFIPRLGAGLFQQHQGGSLRTTGFTERVDLGAIGPLKHDPSIVMRIELPEAGADRSTREPLYLRGVAYNRYDGKTWSNSLPQRRMLTEFPEGTFTVRSAGIEPILTTKGLRQDILLEPLDTAVLFGVSTPASVKGRFLSVQSDLMGALYLPFPSPNRIHYTAYSVVSTVSSAERKATSFQYPEFIARQYLQTPALDAQIIELSRRITHPATSVMDAIQLIQGHVLTNYRYSLDVPALQSAHPLEDFLLTRKVGYCEHYATAMVILLRTVGIPARLVTGYLAAEWNEFGHYYTVRQRDAHAWVEVYFPQSGWITLDPTPASAEAAPQRWWPSPWSVVDSIRLKWDHLFINYSVADQFALVQGLRQGGEAVRIRLSDSLADTIAAGSTLLDRLTRTVFSAGISQWALFLLALTMLAGLILCRANRQRHTLLAEDMGSTSQRAITALYRSMIERFAREGIIKSRSTTPLEFLSQIHEQWPEAEHIARVLTHLYARVRFGQAPLTAEERSSAEMLLQTLHTLTRPAKAVHKAI